MIVLAFGFLTLFLLWRVYRGRRARTLAGLNGERPVFSVEPAARRHSARKHELL